MLVLHGTVLGVDAARHQATIHHEAFGGMPAMTMTFTIDPKGKSVRPGDRVAGTVDENTYPWSIRVLSASAAPPAGAAPFVPLLRPGSIVPDANFVDQAGRALSWRNFRGHTTLVSFIYTRCRDARMCPLVSAKFEAMQSLLPSNARMIEFTLDPAYDTPAVLARYATLFGAHDPPWTLATGDEETMRDIALAFGIGVAARTETTIVHSEALAIVNADGTVRTIVGGNDWRPEEVVAEVRDAEGLQSNPWDRFLLGARAAVGAVGRACGAVSADGHLRPTILFIDGACLIALAFGAFELARALRRP
ncbi:MAG TPA: SCO family protein [Verrucomicrobiae bacterium]|nr:SCO family protein [Verrucomicrobiae bacterium]